VRIIEVKKNSKAPRNRPFGSATTVFLITFLLSLVIYVLLRPEGFPIGRYGGDAAELTAAAGTLGVPHPPGYALYVSLGFLISRLPFPSVAYAVSVMSALATSAAAGVVTLASRHLMRSGVESSEPRPAALRSDTVAISIGLSLALTPLIWLHATFAEVYALNLLFVTLVLFLAITGGDSGQMGRLTGLAIISHPTSFLLMIVILLSLNRRKRLPYLGGTLVGLLPILLIPVLSSTPSPIRWGWGGDIAGLLKMVAGFTYLPNATDLASSLHPSRIAAQFDDLLREWSHIGYLFPLLGAYLLFGARRKAFTILASLVAVYLGFTMIYAVEDSLVYFIPGLMALVLLAAPALHRAGYLSLLLPVALFLTGISSIRQHSSISIAMEPTSAFATVPSRAILVTPGDSTAALLWYFRDVEGYRPDLAIVDYTLFQFDWYRGQLDDRDTWLRLPSNDDWDTFLQMNREHSVICRAEAHGQLLIECPQD